MSKEQFNYQNGNENNDLEAKKDAFQPVLAKERRLIEDELSKNNESKDILGALYSFLIFKNADDLTIEEYLGFRKKVEVFKEFEKDLMTNPKYNTLNFNSLTKKDCRKLINDYLNEYKTKHQFNEDKKEK